MSQADKSVGQVESSRPAAALRRLGWRHRGFRAESQRSALLALLLLLLIPFILDQFGLQGRMRDHLPDLKRWLGVAQTLISDPAQPIYDQDLHPDYLYPPFFLAFFWPLCHIPTWAAAIVFTTAKWAALVVSLRCAWRLCAPPGEDVPPIVALASLLLTWRFFWNDFGQGNINIFILATVVGGGWLLMRGQHVAAGLVVAVAACTKVTPALVLVYFAYKRCWRTLVGAAVGGVVCLLIWPALWLGWANNWALLWDWYEHVVAGYLSRGDVYSIHSNQSLAGIMNRLLGPHVAMHKPDVYLALTVLPPWLLNGLRTAFAAGVLLGLGWACRGRIPPRRRPLAFAAELGLVQIAMLVLSGYSWKMHFVALLVPFSVILAYLADARYPDRPRRWLKILLGLALVLCVMTGDILTPRGADYAEAYGVILWGALATAAGLLVVRARLRQVGSDSVEQPA